MADLDLDAISDRLDRVLYSMWAAGNAQVVVVDARELVAEVDRLRAERDRLKREADQWYADKRLAWAKRDRLRDGIRKHRERDRSIAEAIGSGRTAPHDEELWALLDDNEEVRRD